MTFPQENQAQRILSKVPAVTIFFWIIKVLCTTVGETASDFLNVNLGFGLTGTSIVMGIILVIALVFQFRAKKYVPGIYWLTVVLISIVGTLVTDNLTDAMGVPLEFSTILFSVLLIATFAVWYLREKTLSIHSVFTKCREAFYWLTILFTFALGTAAGDLMAESLGLGYLVTGLIVCAIIVSVFVARKLGLDEDLAFWLTYIMTRPLGASIGDYLSQPQKFGGLGLGATVTSAIFVLAILLTVVFLSITKKDQLSNGSAEVSDQPMRKGFLIQSAAVICLFAAIGGAGYSMQHASLQKESANSMVQTSSQQNTGTISADNSTPPTPAQVQTVSTGAGSSNPSSPTASPAASPAGTSKLGDLSAFLTIEQDMLKLVNTGDLASAKSRADDLELTWDNAQAQLKPKDSQEWTKVDKTIDTVLRQVRAVKPDTSGCKAALEASIAAMGS